ncbi:hypothetical protein [Bacillus sp. Marseille-P3661]|uniref:hypothetical protein n=1 Tax=Bacillus sp. Marseille-P3661 TaxID=1936234 RepID=UPI002155D353|nr:hypothetical protein [Bacillus sp. Marseille-P3661]
MLKKRRSFATGKLILFIPVIIIILIILYSLFTWMSPGNQAKKTVATFYTYEQAGAFSDSWEMFHPLMKQRFSRGHYIQDRAHVFMNHFGVDTFSYSLGNASKEENWAITEGDEAAILETVYKIKVTQTYRGKYGHFDIHQNVFVAKDDEGDRSILWDYKK